MGRFSDVKPDEFWINNMEFLIGLLEEINQDVFDSKGYVNTDFASGGTPLQPLAERLKYWSADAIKYRREAPPGPYILLHDENDITDSYLNMKEFGRPDLNTTQIITYIGISQAQSYRDFVLSLCIHADIIELRLANRDSIIDGLKQILGKLFSIRPNFQFETSDERQNRYAREFDAYGQDSENWLDVLDLPDDVREALEQNDPARD